MSFNKGNFVVPLQEPHLICMATEYVTDACDFTCDIYLLYFFNKCMQPVSELVLSTLVTLVCIMYFVCLPSC